MKSDQTIFKKTTLILCNQRYFFKTKKYDNASYIQNMIIHLI